MFIALLHPQAVFVDLQNPDSTLRKELDTLTAESESKPDDLDTLWETFNKRLPKWMAKYAESGYKENDLIQHSTESDLFDALRLYRESDQTGEPTAEEIQEVTNLMKSQSYVFARRVRDVVRQRLSQPETSDTLKTLWAQIKAEMSKWKQRYKESGKPEGELVSRASKSQLIHALREYRETEQGGAATIEELKDLLQLLKKNSYLIAYRLRQIVRPEQPEAELSNWEAVHQYANSVIDAFRNILRGLHVVDVDEFLDEILHFFQGIVYADMCVATETQLKSIVAFFQPLLTQEVAAWPEYIRDHNWVPKRELVLVSIGISNKTDDEFELVEFTEESSDEIRCDLNALPEDLRTALLKIASEKIYAEAVKELHTDA